MNIYYRKTCVIEKSILFSVQYTGSIYKLMYKHIINTTYYVFELTFFSNLPCYCSIRPRVFGVGEDAPKKKKKNADFPRYYCGRVKWPHDVVVLQTFYNDIYYMKIYIWNADHDDHPHPPHDWFIFFPFLQSHLKGHYFQIIEISHEDIKDFIALKPFSPSLNVCTVLPFFSPVPTSSRLKQTKQHYQ